jgi:hypothetical protein
MGSLYTRVRRPKLTASLRSNPPSVLKRPGMKWDSDNAAAGHESDRHARERPVAGVLAAGGTKGRLIRPPEKMATPEGLKGVAFLLRFPRDLLPCGEPDTLLGFP